MNFREIFFPGLSEPTIVDFSKKKIQGQSRIYIDNISKDYLSYNRRFLKDTDFYRNLFQMATMDLKGHFSEDSLSYIRGTFKAVFQ